MGRHTIRHFSALSLVTLKELAAQPICVILSVCTSALIGWVPLILLHNFSEEGKLARDGALAFHLVIGVGVSVAAASAAINQEVSRGTAASLLSKPISRALFFASKYTGVLLLVGVFCLSATLSALLGERISETMTYTDTFNGQITDPATAWRLGAANILALAWGGFRHWKHGRFGPAVLVSQPILLAGALLLSGCFDRMGAWHPYALQIDLRLIPAHFLIFLILATLSALAATLSTALRFGPTLGLSLAILFVGMIIDAWLPRSGVLQGVIRCVIPNWQHFWQCDALSKGGSISLEHVLNAIRYALLYATAILLVGITIMRNRDVSSP